MNLERLFYCVLSGGLLAYGLGCSDSGDSSQPSNPTLPDFDGYSMMLMASDHPQVYGSTQYDFVVDCHGKNLEIQRSSSADAVWFDEQVSVIDGDAANGYDVTITPGQDENWSAKVTFQCVDGTSKSDAVIANFCYNGPCSDQDKP